MVLKLQMDYTNVYVIYQLVNIHVLLAAQVERHSNSRKMIKYHNIYFSVAKMVLRNVTGQMVLGIVSAVTIPKTIYYI